MASDGQRRFYSQTPSNAPSTASLFQSGGGSQVVQAAFARAPQSLRSTQSYNTLSESPYSSAGRTASLQEQSISDKFSLSPDPSSWGATLAMNLEEPDDELHNPDPRRDRNNDRGGSVFTYRGLTNLGCLDFPCCWNGYPVIPTMTNNYGLIDVDTPTSAHTYTSFADSSQWQLVFSDEFEVEGRTFWPGDDPYWEAVNLHYWQTNDLEWYYPDQVTTRNGSLEITLSEREMNNLSFTSGLLSTWNKFCFTGGMVLASVSLPGTNDVSGLWPAVWSMGNLGRVGYGASLEGMWPYSYDACDVGTAPNQTVNGAPAAAVTGNPYDSSPLSYLPGQRLSRCTCKGESHPGPMHSDGTYVGRSAPEIDVILQGQVSQSAQWAPMNYAYQWSNLSQNYNIPNPDVTQLNSYLGGVYQQSTSGVTNTNAYQILDQNCYTQKTGCFSTYGYQYKPGYSADGGYISWITNDVVGWTLDAGALVADPVTQISDRPIPQEPMYLITNLGISENFQTVDFTNLIFPATMRIDWIRVYQPQGSINIGCDPKDFPTAAYINEYIEAYTNPNLTTWKNDFKQPFPKNNLTTGC
ncbi:glycoside hydrolase family 16 protein [Suillus occidentalis]|nr:glycoside hydrolase family 16 protein [Suillus occidentalis]